MTAEHSRLTDEPRQDDAVPLDLWIELRDERVDIAAVVRIDPPAERLDVRLRHCLPPLLWREAEIRERPLTVEVEHEPGDLAVADLE
jgi:hypothetical protein